MDSNGSDDFYTFSGLYCWESYSITENDNFFFRCSLFARNIVGLFFRLLVLVKNHNCSYFRNE